MRKLMILMVLVLFCSFIVSASMSVINQADNVKQYQVEISVSKGWNLISSGLTFAKNLPYLDESGDIKRENIKAVYVYANKINEYIEVYPNYDERLYNSTNYFYGDEQDIIGIGNWIYVDKSGILRYKTKGIKDLGYRKLFSGWNFVSITKEMINNSLDNIKGSCLIESTYNFNSYSQKWIPLFPKSDILGDYYTGKGIIIKTANDCFLGSNADVDSSLPSFPESYGLNCTDSDGGKNYFVKGTITKGSSKADDECNKGAYGTNRRMLVEYFCNNDEIDIDFYTCPNGCENGVCSSESVDEDIGCTDSDGGDNIYVDGSTSNFTYSSHDHCIVDSRAGKYWVYEFYCEGDNVVGYQKECEKGCEYHACIE